MRVEQFNIIQESEFSELVAETYGRPYRLQQQGDMMGQMVIRFVSVPNEPHTAEGEHWQAVPMAEWLAADPPGPEALDNFVECLRWDREFYPMLEYVVNDLHAKGLMAAGKYGIYAYW